MLRDPQKRQVYDRYGHEGLRTAARAVGGVNVDLSEICSAICSAVSSAAAAGSGRNRGPRRGADIEDVLDVDLLEAATGVKKTFNVRYEANCKRVRRQRREAGHASDRVPAVQGFGRGVRASTAGCSRSRRRVAAAAVAAS